MGKLLHKLVHGIIPSWVFTGFRRRRTDAPSKKELHLRLRQSIHFIPSSKSSASALPSSSAPLELVDLLTDMDQSPFYYSKSEDEEEQPITGDCDCIEIESESGDEDDVQIHAMCYPPQMGICALAATSIIEGSWHEDEHELRPSQPNKDIKYCRPPASVVLQSHHDTDDNQEYLQQEGCLDRPPLQQQSRKPTRETGLKSEYHHHAGDGSLCMHDNDVYCHYHHTNHDVYEYHHNGQTHGSTGLCHIRKHGRTKPFMRSCTLSSLAKGVKKSNIDDHRPCLGGFKRKSICLNEDDGKDDGSVSSAWPCIKRQKIHEGGDVACELPESISDKVGDGCAVVWYGYQDPQFAFWESMVQMIVGNELWGRSELEFLLHCYLALNDAHLHHTIYTSFFQVLKDLQQSLPQWALVDK